MNNVQDTGRGNNKLSEFLIKAAASGLGAGYSPVASGTVGCALPAFIWWFMPGSLSVKLSAAALLTAVSIPISTAAEKLYGKKDDSRIVIDEAVGMWISLLFMPREIKYYASAFLFFRLFDVIKPLGIKKIQGLKGGWGIVADDFFAGLLANACVWAAMYAGSFL